MRVLCLTQKRAIQWCVSMTKQLILGGAKSGKSRYGEKLAKSSTKRPVYIATAQALDAEMKDRVAQHQRDRSGEWALVEEPIHLVQSIKAHDAADCCILVDCLTLWISNCLHQQCWAEESDALLALLPSLKGDLIMVSNEVGSGIVPLGALSREFVDAAGRLHQDLAERCDEVVLVVAGLPLALKTSHCG